MNQNFLAGILRLRIIYNCYYLQGRSKARQKKMYQIAQLLEIPGQIGESTVSLYNTGNLRGATSGAKLPREHRPLFSTVNRVPGFAAALKRDSSVTGGVSRVQLIATRAGAEGGESSQGGAVRKPFNSTTAQLRDNSLNNSPKSRDSSKGRNSATPRSRDGSPRMPRPR